MKTFSSDLAYGKKAELAVLKKLLKLDPTLKLSRGKEKKWDIVGDSGMSIEVKCDLTSKRTGNIGIETRYWGKPSGIEATKSSHWVHIFHLEGMGWVYSLMKTSELKHYLELNKEHFRKINGGDSMASEMILIPVENFITAFECNSV